MRNLATFDRSGRLQALHDGIKMRTRSKRQTRCRQCIHHIVSARQCKGDRLFSGWRMQFKNRLLATQLNMGRTNIGIIFNAVTKNTAVANTLCKIRRKRIVGINHGDAVIRKRFINRALGFCDAKQAAHAFQVCRTNIIDDRNLRRDNTAQIGDITGLAGTHFVNRKLGIFRRFQNGHRQADFIVAITRSGISVATATQNFGD